MLKIIDLHKRGDLFWGEAFMIIMGFNPPPDFPAPEPTPPLPEPMPCR